MKKNSTASSTHEEEVLTLDITIPKKSDAEMEAGRLRHEEQKLFKTCVKTRDFKPYFNRYPHGQFTQEDANFILQQHPPVWLACLCFLIAIIAVLASSPVFWILLILYFVFF